MAISATGKRRLLKLADFLETANIPRKRFDMGAWAEQVDGEKADTRLIDCGTAACACGWATTIPSFRRAGLRLTADPALPFQPDLTFRWGNGKVWRNGDAAERFFGIEEDDVRTLFVSDSYASPPTPKQVARRIRKFVKDTEAEHAASTTKPRSVRATGWR